jgi:hypothetical protein
MTRQEFQDGVARFKRSLMIPLAVAFVGIAIWVIVIFALKNQVLSLGAELFGVGNAELICPLLLAIVIISMLIASGISHRPIRQDPNVHCPQCGKFLASGRVRTKLSATGRCPCCGFSMFTPEGND